MTSFRDFVTARGGMTTKRTLVAHGATDRQLTAVVRSGELTRVRNGWYSTLPESDMRLRAVRVGGRLTGLAAIAALGGWVLGTPALHVAVRPNSSRLRAPGDRRVRLTARRRAGAHLHWESFGQSTRGDLMIVDVRDALIRVILDEPWEVAIAAIDWALYEERIDMSDVGRIAAALPADLRHIVDWVDPECDSLPESLSRTRLRIAGHRIVSQVDVDGRPVDLLVDDEVALEIDGEEFHLTRFFEDRDKDLDITMARYHSIRPSAKHVFSQWPRVYAAVATALDVRGVTAVGNSGVGAGRARANRAAPGRPLGRRRRSPEFPTGGGEREARGAAMARGARMARRAGMAGRAQALPRT